MSATDLAELVRRREVSASDVVEAFVRRIDDVNPQLNAFVVDRFEQARTCASAIDQEIASSSEGTLARPLLGVPVVIKEMFDVEGMPTTVGLANRKKHRARRDAVTVRRLKEAGAIVVGKSNVPQLGMLPETDNPVYGRTNHPDDPHRTCGGSSGGDAALVAKQAIPLTLSSDGAGSIRMPAHFCGVCGFKPTGGRVSMEGHWLSTNWPHDWAQPGPIARSVADLKLGFQAIEGSPQDLNYGEIRPSLVHNPAWEAFLTKAAKCERPLRVGLFSSMDILPSGPTAHRATEELARRLQRLGVEPVPITLRRSEECWDLFMQVFYAEALSDMRRQASGQPLDWRVRQAFLNAKMPRLVRPLISFVAGRMGQPRISKLMKTLDRPTRTTAEYGKLLARVMAMRGHFHRWMNRESLDFLAGPVGPGPAFPHGDFYASFVLGYTGIFNLLGMPAATIPVTQVSEDDVAEWAQTLGQPRDWCEQSLAKANEGSEGLPFGIQLIGKWWDDSRLLELLERIEQIESV